MPLPFIFAPLVALTAKSLGTLLATTAVVTMTTALTHDAYQKLKDSARSNDDNKRNRN